MRKQRSNEEGATLMECTGKGGMQKEDRKRQQRLRLDRYRKPDYKEPETERNSTMNEELIILYSHH